MLFQEPPSPPKKERETSKFLRQRLPKGRVLQDKSPLLPFLSLLRGQHARGGSYPPPPLRHTREKMDKKCSKTFFDSCCHTLLVFPQDEGNFFVLCKKPFAIWWVYTKEGGPGLAQLYSTSLQREAYFLSGRKKVFPPITWAGHSRRERKAQKEFKKIRRRIGKSEDSTFLQSY